MLKAKVLDFICQKVLEIKCHFLLESTCRLHLISNDKLATILVPLPSLEEQHRIVAKIEELLPNCDQLIK